MVERKRSVFLHIDQDLSGNTSMPADEQILDSVFAKPRVFIGSSTKGLSIAEKFQKCLKSVADCTMWTDDVFVLGLFTLESLVITTRGYDFAVLVLTADDVIYEQDELQNIPRANLIFESGLFIGTIGRERTFIVIQEGVNLPSDLDGLTHARFSPKNLSKACKELQKVIARRPNDIPELDGKWYSAYQRHDDPVGDWVEDMIVVRSTPSGKLSFRNFQDQVGSNYEALGKFSGEKEIVGIWSETLKGANARGTFHLCVNPFGRWLYGLCTGPTRSTENIYSGWLLARDYKNLRGARQDLVNALVPGSRRDEETIRRLLTKRRTTKLNKEVL